VFVLATTRPEVTDQPAAAQVITTLEQEARLDVMRLEPLARDAVRELAETVLLKGVVADALVDWLDARTRVNPLFAIDLLRALVEEGANLSSPRLERLPERLRDRVGLRLQPLDESSSTRWPSGRSGRRHRADVDAFTGIKALREMTACSRARRTSPDGA
jgi:hypothetical protein